LPGPETWTMRSAVPLPGRSFTFLTGFSSGFGAAGGAGGVGPGVPPPD
jgi:hypothetical protein